MKLVDLINIMCEEDKVDLVGYGVRCSIEFLRHYVIENVQNAEVQSIQSADNFLYVDLTDKCISGLHDDDD